MSLDYFTAADLQRLFRHEWMGLSWRSSGALVTKHPHCVGTRYRIPLGSLTQATWNTNILDSAREFAVLARVHGYPVHWLRFGVGARILANGQVLEIQTWMGPVTDVKMIP